MIGEQHKYSSRMDQYVTSQMVRRTGRGRIGEPNMFRSRRIQRIDWAGGGCGSSGWMADEDLLMGWVKEEFVSDDRMDI